MKVAYVFATNTAATYKLATMILPQLEDGSHGASVVGMFFFDDNLFACARATPWASGWRRSPPSKTFCSWCAISAPCGAISPREPSSSAGRAR